MSTAMSDAPPKALRSLQDFLDAEIDYLVVGGGTAGLTVAARLSEDPAVRVGVLEAGDAHLHDESLLTPAAFAKIIESPDYDWQLRTVPQVCYVVHFMSTCCVEADYSTRKAPITSRITFLAERFLEAQAPLITCNMCVVNVANTVTGTD